MHHCTIVIKGYNQGRGEYIKGKRWKWEGVNVLGHGAGSYGEERERGLSQGGLKARKERKSFIQGFYLFLVFFRFQVR